MKKTIGLLFGSFNPVHNGHLAIAQAVVNAAFAHEVWLVVSPQNPFKDPKSLLNQYDRLHLARLATENNPHLRASDFEFQLPKPSYTIDTLTYLQERHPHHQLVLIMGADNLQSFHRWKNYEQILKYYTIVVYPRLGYQTPIEYQNHPTVRHLDVPLIDISATYIRQLVANKASARYLVPDKVHEYMMGTNWWR